MAPGAAVLDVVAEQVVVAAPERRRSQRRRVPACRWDVVGHRPQDRRISALAYTSELDSARCGICASSRVCSSDGQRGPRGQQDRDVAEPCRAVPAAGVVDRPPLGERGPDRRHHVVGLGGAQRRRVAARGVRPLAEQDDAGTGRRCGSG